MDFRKCLLVFSILFFSMPICFAQNQGEDFVEKNYVAETVDLESENEEIEDVEETPVEDKWQQLEWEEENPDFVQYYEVIIQKYDEEFVAYSEINRLKTEDNSSHIRIQPLLQPGNYRFKVITYDLIGLPSVESEWKTFSIYKAFKPQINDISSKVNGSSTLYLEEMNDGIFSVSGRNLFETSKNEKDIQFTKYFVVNQNDKKQNILVPEILNVENNNRKIEFV